MARKSKLAGEDLAGKKKKFESVAGNLEEISVENFLKDNFLPYAWSFNLDRALVDVTGLKPVHRRILYTMYKDGLSPNSNRSKVATLGGKVLAYHPHGNVAVEEALKNLGREHVFRVPLIDGKGDYGIPGTPGASGRYIEARLNKAAWLNVEEIAENAVKMVPNYDNTTKEPVRIPVKWPVSVINGGSGIAIAYASMMPSHNPTEIMKAIKSCLRNPDITDKALQKIILGPDFNMGGIITSNDGVKEYLETGSGSFKIRGQYEVSHKARGVVRIEFYEIPFGSDPEKIIQEVQTQTEKGRFKEISVYKDLRDRKNDIKLIFETKPGVQYKKVIKDLFAYTSLESSFSANITTIVDNKPQVSSMKNLLLDFIEFRKECVFNKMSYSLKKKENRLHLVKGLILTLLDIDGAIKIIRNSNDSEDANIKLQKKFKIDELQADYVLALQLKRLTKMDKVELKNEEKELNNSIKEITSILTDNEVLKNYLIKEFDETLKVIGDERKTVINIGSLEEFLDNEKAEIKEIKTSTKNLPCYITRFVNGSILKTSEPFFYSQKLKNFKYSPIVEEVKMNTQDSIVIIDKLGTGYRIPISYINEKKPSDAKNLGLKLKDNFIVGISKNESAKSDIGLAMASKEGLIKISKTDFPVKDEFPVFLLSDGDELVDSRWLGRTLSNSFFTLVSSNGSILVFDASTIRVAGSKAGGVRGMKLKESKDKVISFNWVNSLKDNFILSQTGKTVKLTMIQDIPTKNKGGMGVSLHAFKKDEKELTNAFVGNNLVMSVMNSSAMLPPVTKRAARGVDFTLDADMGVSEILVM